MAVMPMSSSFDEEVTNFFKYYQDRGMKKWAGYFLSDHTMKMNREKAAARVAASRKEEAPMTMTAISEILLTAFAGHYPVSLQLKEVDENGQPPADISGFVAGWHEDNIIIEHRLLPLDQINHVKLLTDEL